jgi:hypothetical protein
MRISLVLCVIFAPIAAAMAYLITYEEYRHHFPERGRAVREGMVAALLALVVFLALGALAGVLMPRLTG